MFFVVDFYRHATHTHTVDPFCDGDTDGTYELQTASPYTTF